MCKLHARISLFRKKHVVAERAAERIAEWQWHTLTHVRRPLEHALHYNKTYLAIYLIENGADIRPSEYISYICEKGNLYLLIFFHKKYGLDLSDDDEWSLRMACLHGQLHIVKYLHENGCDIHIKQERPLLNAIHKGHLDIVKYLISHGANIHRINDALIWTPRDNAELRKYLELVICDM